MCWVESQIIQRYVVYSTFCKVRSDLPGYLADSEADGVCVIK